MIQDGAGEAVFHGETKEEPGRHVSSLILYKDPYRSPGERIPGILLGVWRNGQYHDVELSIGAALLLADQIRAQLFRPGRGRRKADQSPLNEGAGA